jgi:GAF domain-containing protein
MNGNEIESKEELLQLSRRHEEEVSVLLKASKAVLESRPFAETARIIFDHACAITGATSGYIALMTPDGRENEVLFLEAGGLECTVDPELPMPIRGLRADAYRSAKPVCSNDFWESEWYRFLPEGHVELRNVMFAPLVIDGTVRGVMGLANKPEDFTARDEEIAGALGEFAAIALRNARNLDKIQQTVKELQRTISEVKTLRGIIPICMRCKKIRDEEGYWQQVEVYISQSTDSDFSHGLCDDCAETLYGKDFKEEAGE